MGHRPRRYRLTIGPSHTTQARASVSWAARSSSTSCWTVCTISLTARRCPPQISQNFGVPGSTSSPCSTAFLVSFSSLSAARFVFCSLLLGVNADVPFMLIAHLVARNEADRYLTDCLSALAPLVDHIHLFDDKSTDATPFIARDLGAEVYTRPDGCPSFLDHEGLFRQAAWESMGTLPEGSWVVCLDADEFLTADPRPHAWGSPKRLKVREVFDIRDGEPMVRIDGFWDRIEAARLAPWTPHSAFPDRAMGCGSLPLAVSQGPFETLSEPQILHYGYVRPEDREDKLRRYRSRPGHNPKHVASITKAGRLRKLRSW
jgi:hypothetical protein